MLVSGRVEVHVSMAEGGVVHKAVVKSQNGTFSDGQEHSLILQRNKRSRPVTMVQVVLWKSLLFFNTLEHKSKTLSSKMAQWPTVSFYQWEIGLIPSAVNQSYIWQCGCLLLHIIQWIQWIQPALVFRSIQLPCAVAVLSCATMHECLPSCTISENSKVRVL